MGPEKKRKEKKRGRRGGGGEGTKFNSSKSNEMKWNYEYNMIQNHWLQSSE